VNACHTRKVPSHSPTIAANSGHPDRVGSCRSLGLVSSRLLMVPTNS